MTADLVRCVTHAVLNDLAVVRLLLDVAGPPGADDHLATRVERVGDIVYQLGLVMREDEQVEMVDVGQAIAEIDDLLAAVAGSAVTVRVDLPDHPVLAEVRPAALQRQVLHMVRAATPGQPGTTVVVRVHQDPCAALVSVGTSTDMPLRARPPR